MHGHHPDLVGALLHPPLHRHLVAVDPVEETGQARRLDRLVGERLVEQRVDAVLGLGPEPGDELPPPVVADEDAGQHLERPQVVGLRQQVVEQRPRLGPALGRLFAQRPPQASLARMRELEELALARRRRAGSEQRREREVVARGRGDAERGEEVVDGELAADPEQVGAGDRHALALERPDDRVEEVGAPLDEDHDVAGADRPAVRVAGQGAAARQPAGDLARDAPGQDLDRVVGGAGVDRLVPRALVRLLRLRQERPELDAAGLARGRSHGGRSPGASPCPARPPNTASTSARIGRAERNE